MEKEERFYTVGGSADWCSHCGKQRGDTSKYYTRNCLITQRFHFWEFSQRNPNTDLKVHKQTYIHCGIICNHQDMEAARASISTRIAKTSMGPLHNGILHSHKNENFTLCSSMDGPGEHYAKRNKPVRERQIPYDFTHMWNLMNKLN